MAQDVNATAANQEDVRRSAPLLTAIVADVCVNANLLPVLRELYAGLGEPLHPVRAGAAPKQHAQHLPELVISYPLAAVQKKVKGQEV